MFLGMFILASVVISISICCCFRVTLALGEMLPNFFICKAWGKVWVASWSFLVFGVLQGHSPNQVAPGERFLD